MTQLGTRARSAARMLLGSTGAAVEQLRGADAVLGTGLPLSRRLGVVALAGGSGTTSVAASLASLFARRRTGMVLGVDAAGGHLGLARQTVTVPAGKLAMAGECDGRHEAAAARRRSARTAADACAGLVATASGLHLLDIAGPDRRAASAEGWGQAVDPIARFFDLVLTDWGVRAAADDLADVVASSHILVVVARADRHAATAAASALAEVGEGPAAPRTVLSLVDVGRSPDRMAARLERALGRPVLLLPHEPERSRTMTPTSRRFSSGTRNAHIRLAVTVMDEAIASQTPAATGGRGGSGAGTPGPGRSGAGRISGVEAAMPQ